MPHQTSLTRLEQVPEERCMTVEVEVPKEVEEEVCQEVEEERCEEVVEERCREEATETCDTVTEQQCQDLVEEVCTDITEPGVCAPPPPPQPQGLGINNVNLHELSKLKKEFHLSKHPYDHVIYGRPLSATQSWKCNAKMLPRLSAGS